MSKTQSVESPSRFVSCRAEDRAKFMALCERETRSQSDQFQVILREAYERRGLDFETGEPISGPRN